jgi:two-component system, cell cycle sensor histidine kinase and response regulator CckA
MTRRWHTSASILALAAFYFCASKFGLSLAFVHASATAVWPSSGIALAVLLLWGYRLWPGIFLGAFLVNITTQGSVATTLGVAAGNTLEALLGAWFVNRFAGGLKAFERARNIFKFVLLAAILSTALSATIGVTSLSLGGFAQWDQYPAIWLTWYLGDMVGDLIVAPLLVIWMTQPLFPLKSKRILEGAALLLTVILVGLIMFLGKIPSGVEYLAIPPLLWAAFRFGERGAVTSVFVMSGIALLGTLQGHGPFATLSPHTSLLLLQAFLGSITMIALVLAAVVAEHKRAEERLQLQDTVSRILAESPALREAAPKIVQVLCEGAGWEVGAVWNLDRTANELVCVEVWHLPSVNVPEFEATTRQRSFAPGIGLPGRVWSSGKPAWVPDVTKDSNFPRASVATKEELHAAFCFPIKLGDEILGVIECFSREVREPDDHFLRMVGDIGTQLGQFIERKRAEEGLRAKEAQLRLVTDSSAVMLAQCSRDLRYRFVNRACAEFLGRTPDEIVGKPIVEILGEEAYKRIRPYVEMVLQGRPVEFETEVPYERIGRRFMRVAYTPEKDAKGNVLGWVAAISDITEHKRAEAAVRQNEERTRLIFDTSLDAVITIDRQGCITDWNPQAEKVFGWTKSKAIGKKLAEAIIPHRYREAHERGLRHYLDTGVGPLLKKRIELTALHLDGREFPVELAITPVVVEDQIYFSAFIRDITERKEAEEALLRAKDLLAKSNEELETRVRERTGELEQAHAALLRDIEEQKRLEAELRQAQKMESIGTLAGGIAHDFNNILNIIKGYTSLLAGHRSADATVTESLKVIDQAIERGASTVRELLTMARKTEPLLVPTSANDVISKLTRLLRETFPKMIDIVLDLDPKLPPIMADPNQISQALLNLCVNARDAMPTGGRLILRTTVVDGRKVQERHAEAKTEPYVCIEVIDSGVGIDEDIRSRIFEPFFTTKGTREGTGLGLAIVYGIVKNHNGFIDVESAANRGTTLRLYLPVALSEEERSMDEMTRRESLGSKRAASRGTILLVEDEENMVHLLRKVLSRHGYQALVALDGEEAIDLYHRHKLEIDVVLLDLGLPKIAGWDVILKMKEENPGVKVVVASGYIEPELKSEMYRAGVKDFVYKPYTIDHVVETLQTLIENP